MKKNFAPYYTLGKLVFKNGEFTWVGKDNLYSKGIYPTKLKESDIPEHYIKLWDGIKYIFLNLKDIADVKYKPCHIEVYNHLLKDDYVYISYKGELTEEKDEFGVSYTTSKDYNIIFGRNILLVIRMMLDNNYQWGEMLKEQVLTKIKNYCKYNPNEGIDYEYYQNYLNGKDD